MESKRLDRFNSHEAVQSRRTTTHNQRYNTDIKTIDPTSNRSVFEREINENQNKILNDFKMFTKANQRVEDPA